MWEHIDSYTSRMKVPFGWIVSKLASKMELSVRGDWEEIEAGISLCFVPDPFHWWRLPKAEDGGES